MRMYAGLLAVVLTFAGSANAAPLDITNIQGSWLNVVPGPGGTSVISNVGGQGTDTVRWPSPGDPNQSGYNFTPSGDIIGAALNTPLLLGTFQHINQVVGSSILSVDYSFGFSTNGNPPSLSDTFHFDHNETPNSTGTSPADDDIVTISSVFLNQVIIVGGDTYFFNLLGFSTNNGATFSSVFSSPEGGTNTAKLYGQITAQPVPEPGTLMLFSTGIVIAAGRLRRRTRMTA
jgi:hypothetical protein